MLRISGDGSPWAIKTPLVAVASGDHGVHENTIMFYIYVLRSQKSGYRYIGQTSNLKRRLKEHNAGLTKSIRFQLPFRLVYIEEVPYRDEARRREKFLKSGKGREWLDKKGI